MKARSCCCRRSVGEGEDREDEEQVCTVVEKREVDVREAMGAGRGRQW